MAMSLEEARAEARRLIALDPKFRQMNMDTLVAKIMANEGMDRGPIQTPGGVSEERIFSGFLPKPVTPASPAPMKPGVPVMAPRPEAVQLPQPAMGGPLERARAATPAAPAADTAPPAPPAPEGQRKPFASPLRAALRQAQTELDTMNSVAEQIKSTGQNLPADAKLRIDLAQRNVASLQAQVEAEEAAEIDPEVAKILARQETGIEEERARLAADKARAPWDALTAGGLALMNPRKGANFLGALGEGLGVGLEAYDTARAQAAERKARLGKEGDQIALQRIDALAKARQDARDAIRRGEEVSERSLRMASLTDEAIVDAGTQQARIDKAIADASKAGTEARYAGEDAQSIIDLRRAQAEAARRRDSGGGSGSPTATSTFKAQKDAEKKASDLRIKAAKAFATWKENTPSGRGLTTEQSGPEWDNYNAIRQEYRYWRDAAGRKTPFGGKKKTVNFEDL